jgi:hypothetical protein
MPPITTMKMTNAVQPFTLNAALVLIRILCIENQRADAAGCFGSEQIDEEFRAKVINAHTFRCPCCLPLMTRGHSGLLFLSCQRLSLFTLCRSPSCNLEIVVIALSYFSLDSQPL